VSQSLHEGYSAQNPALEQVILEGIGAA